MTRGEVANLLEKYEVMRELRLLHGEPPRDRLRELARRFPGALAEIDRITPTLLDERIRQLQAILDRPEIRDLPAWVRGWILTHGRLRGALAIKAWLGGKRVVDEATRARFDRDPFEDEARVFRDRLHEIADPPGGRLVSLVYHEVAQTLGIAADEVRTLLMPRP